MASDGDLVATARALKDSRDAYAHYSAGRANPGAGHMESQVQLSAAERGRSRCLEARRGWK